jgi:leucyl-tRNA synthetase
MGDVVARFKRARGMNVLRGAQFGAISSTVGK